MDGMEEGSSDPHHEGAYSLPSGKVTQPYTVKCPPPPKDLKRGFACEQGSLGEQSIQHALISKLIHASITCLKSLSTKLP